MSHSVAPAPGPRAPAGSLRARLLASFLLPTLALFLAAGAVVYGVSRAALEDELGRSLSAQAAAAAALLSPERFLLLQPGDEDTRTYRNLSRTLEELRGATRARRLFAFDGTGKVHLDVGGALPIGADVPELARDRRELMQTLNGKAGLSSVLFEGVDGRMYKTGYAPLWDGSRVVGAVGVEAPAAFFAPLRRLWRTLWGVAGMALLTLAALASFTARGLTRPLDRLVKSALRMGAGDLGTRVPSEPTREIGTLAGELEAMRQALEARERQMRMMLAGVAHEVRNPMGGMELFIGLLEEELAAKGSAELSEARTHASHVHAELDHLKQVVDSFLAFARDQKLSPEPVELGALVSSAAALLAAEARSRGVHLKVAAEAARTVADPALLQAAIVNLLKNALQASPREGEVELTGRAVGTEYHVQVQDPGPGVPLEAEARIFEPFFTTREKGTGLGLALARKIAQAHGGTLVLERSDRGARFRLSLPLL